MTLQDRIDELVAQHGSLRAVARVTEIDVGYLSRLRTGIGSSKKRTYLGLFDTAEEAHEAYLQAKRRMHEGCTI